MSRWTDTVSYKIKLSYLLVSFKTVPLRVGNNGFVAKLKHIWNHYKSSFQLLGMTQTNSIWNLLKSNNQINLESSVESTIVYRLSLHLITYLFGRFLACLENGGFNLPLRWQMLCIIYLRKLLFRIEGWNHPQIVTNGFQWGYLIHPCRSHC